MRLIRPFTFLLVLLLLVLFTGKTIAQTNIDAVGFSSVKDNLRLRIYPVSAFEKLGDVGSLIAREDLEGTRTVLVFEKGGFTPVSQEQAKGWKQPQAALFEAAEKQVAKQEIEIVKSDVPTPVGTVEMYILGNENYAASYVLHLQRNKPELVGDWGSVIAVAHNGIANIHRISKDKPMDFVMFIQLVLPAVEEFYKQSPEPINTNFYWYYRGKFQKIDVRRDATGTVNVTTPPELTSLIASKE